MKPFVQQEISQSERIGERNDLQLAISRAVAGLFHQKFEEGYWWYTLEANESINAEFILLMHYLGAIDQDTQFQIGLQIQGNQNPDGSWSIFHGGPGDLSTTIECYLSLKLSGLDTNSSCLTLAKDFILANGGLSKCRVFTRIHLALFGILPWKACPAMPVSMVHLPLVSPVNIYEFSSWARACIVPLLVLLHQKKSAPIRPLLLDELYVDPKETWDYASAHPLLSLDNFFSKADIVLKQLEKYSLIPFKESALRKCEDWIREHLHQTADIFPALAYGAMALSSLGYSKTDPSIQKALGVLKKFRILVQNNILTSLPTESFKNRTVQNHFQQSYQQCCISPVWDTPWAGLALLEAGVPLESLLKTGRWLISKQILHTYGDWSRKSPNVQPGGWAFEFENDYFPDVDDTIQVLNFLHRLPLPMEEKGPAIKRGMDWFLAMQSRNGGWAAFDVNNTKEWVNKIPFSDHGACLDPPTPDITGRAIELLALMGYQPAFQPIVKALNFLKKTQEENGSWWGRWGVNYIYGTWCVLQGFKTIRVDKDYWRVKKAIHWLESIQHEDGGFGESCDSYNQNSFVDLNESTASQTAWGLMALIAGDQGQAPSAKRAANYLISHQNQSGSWDELYHTGTGFPGHFYIRYHGYRHYFPTLALAKFRQIDLSISL